MSDITTDLANHAPKLWTVQGLLDTGGGCMSVQIDLPAGWRGWVTEDGDAWTLDDPEGGSVADGDCDTPEQAIACLSVALQEHSACPCGHTASHIDHMHPECPIRVHAAAERDAQMARNATARDFRLLTDDDTTCPTCDLWCSPEEMGCGCGWTWIWWPANMAEATEVLIAAALAHPAWNADEGADALVALAPTLAGTTEGRAQLRRIDAACRWFDGKMFTPMESVTLDAGCSGCDKLTEPKLVAYSYEPSEATFARLWDDSAREAGPMWRRANGEALPLDGGIPMCPDCWREYLQACEREGFVSEQGVAITTLVSVPA
jgi:hypothetical protein